MSDPISRSDAIWAKPEYRNEDMLDKEKSTYNKGWNDCNDAWVAIIKALPSADAVHIETYRELYEKYVNLKHASAEAVSMEDAMQIQNTILFKEYLRGRRNAEAVQGEWIDRSDGGRIKYPWWESNECNQCGEYGSGAYNFCPNCGAKMTKGR